MLQDSWKSMGQTSNYTSFEYKEKYGDEQTFIDWRACWMNFNSSKECLRMNRTSYGLKWLDEEYSIIVFRFKNQ
jgi:hypothetical protein